MRGFLSCLGLAGLLLAAAVSLQAATNAPADTNFIDPALTAENPQLQQLNDELKKEHLGNLNTESLLNTKFLFASLFWGTMGGGYLLYARKQREAVPFLGGVAMIALSFFIVSWFWMSLACIGVGVGVYLLKRQGW